MIREYLTEIVDKGKLVTSENKCLNDGYFKTSASTLNNEVVVIT